MILVLVIMLPLWLFVGVFVGFQIGRAITPREFSTCYGGEDRRSRFENEHSPN